MSNFSTINFGKSFAHGIELIHKAFPASQHGCFRTGCLLRSRTVREASWTPQNRRIPWLWVPPGWSTSHWFRVLQEPLNRNEENMVMPQCPEGLISSWDNIPLLHWGEGMQGGLLPEPSLGRVPGKCTASDFRDLLQAGIVSNWANRNRLENLCSEEKSVPYNAYPSLKLHFSSC